MRLLLDAHVFLWYISADPKLMENHRAAIQDPANEVYMSAASVWEAVIKHGLGKLPLPAPPAEYLPRSETSTVSPLCRSTRMRWSTSPAYPRFIVIRLTES